MIDELNGNPLHVCMCYSREALRYVAHCLELDLIGEGETKPKARSSLKELIEIQWRVCEGNGLDLQQADGYDPWKEYYDRAHYNLRDTLVVQPNGAREGKTFVFYMEIDNRTRCVRNLIEASWPSERSLSDIQTILRDKGVLFHRVPDKPRYGYFLGSWGAESNGILQSYPLYAPDGTRIMWYHLRGIASRFGLNDLTL